jgi:hypothetical protein
VRQYFNSLKINFLCFILKIDELLNGTIHEELKQ